MLSFHLFADKQSYLIAVGHEIRRFMPSGSKESYNDAVISGRRIQALDVDPSRKLAYWSDSSERTIKRAVIPDDPMLMGYPQDLQIIDIGNPTGIAFDWVAK